MSYNGNPVNLNINNYVTFIIDYAAEEQTDFDDNCMIPDITSQNQKCKRKHTEAFEV